MDGDLERNQNIFRFNNAGHDFFITFLFGRFRYESCEPISNSSRRPNGLKFRVRVGRSADADTTLRFKI